MRNTHVQRARRSIEEAIEFVTNAKDVQNRAGIVESLRSQLVYLNEYAREPFLWGVKESLDVFFDAVQDLKLRLYFSSTRLVSPQDKQRIEQLLLEIQTNLDGIGSRDVRSIYESDFLRATEVAKQLFSAGSEQASQERLLRVEEGSFEWAKMVLSLSDHATKDEARVAYRQLVFKHHPDRQSPENASQATKITADLNRAYDIILRHLDRMHH